MNALKGMLLTWAPFHWRFPSASRAMTYEVDRRIAVDRDRGFIYFRIPKAANSTVTATLFPSDQAEVAPDEAKRAFVRASDLSRREVAELTQRFFLFTVVRNPYVRLASAYLHKIKNGIKARHQVLESFRCANPDEVSFAEFCRFIAEGGRNLNPHWYRQVDLIPCGVERLHFVGRVESLAEDMASITARIGGGVRGKMRNITVHGTGASEKLRELYSAETVAIVRESYAADFAKFGYRTEPEWIKGLR